MITTYRKQSSLFFVVRPTPTWTAAAHTTEPEAPFRTASPAVRVLVVRVVEPRVRLALLKDPRPMIPLLEGARSCHNNG
jgi:hypothetical protein